MLYGSNATAGGHCEFFLPELFLDAELEGGGNGLQIRSPRSAVILFLRSRFFDFDFIFCGGKQDC